MAHSSSVVAVASDASSILRRSSRRNKAAMSVAGTKEEKMRVILQSELLRASKIELHAMLRRIAAELPALPEGSHELRIAHLNLHNIRRALARPQWGLTRP
jgi:hypothetical protein